MNTNESRGSVLIVATDRDDRRVLFDALDSQEFDAIYTAKDVAQARAFLGGFYWSVLRGREKRCWLGQSPARRVSLFLVSAPQSL